MISERLVLQQSTIVVCSGLHSLDLIRTEIRLSVDWGCGGGRWGIVQSALAAGLG